MAGKGHRFIKAGYKTYKPFLLLSKKENIIQNICNSFPKKIIIIMLSAKLKIII